MTSRATSTQSHKVIEKPKVKVAKARRVEEKEKKEKTEAFKVFIGPPKLTRFERARIVGARALQLSLGAPPFIPITPDVKDTITLATLELGSKALPISIRRALPNGTYQDIPIDVLL